MSFYIKAAAKLSIIAIAVVIFTGCYKEPKAKYTPEQLKNFPMPKVSGLPKPTGGLVLAVNGETLGSDEVISLALVKAAPMAKEMDYESFAPAVYPFMKQLLTDKVTNLLLYQRAKITVPESIFEEGGKLDTAVDSEVRRFLATYENNYALAQQEIEKQGYDWKTYRDYQRKQILAQTYFTDKIDRDPAITHNQIVDFYNKNRESQFKNEPKTSFLLIDIPKGDNSDGALAKAQKAIEDIKGGKDFAQCITEYSQGIKDKTGGLWETKDPSSFVAPYDAITAKLDNMRKDHVSDVIDAEGHFFIVKLIENIKGGYTPVEDVQQDIEKHLKSVKRQEQMEKLLKELFEQADITGLEGFLTYCIQQTYIKARS